MKRGGGAGEAEALSVDVGGRGEERGDGEAGLSDQGLSGLCRWSNNCSLSGCVSFRFLKAVMSMRMPAEPASSSGSEFCNFWYDEDSGRTSARRPPER